MAAGEDVVDLQQVIEAMPQIVWLTAPDGAHTYFNQQWMAFTGLTLEESLGDGWNPPFHPEDRPRAAARWAWVTRTGEPYVIEYRLRRADGVYRWMLGRALPLRGPSGEIVGWVGTCTDIEELKQAQAHIDEQSRLLADALSALRVQATHDPLTGLANRTLLFDQLELLLGQRHGAGVAVAFIDLDDFKAVNDRLGHRAGDDLLVHVAGQLRATARQGDVVARMGGDEFVVVGEAEDAAAALEMGRRLAAAVADDVELDGRLVPVSASIGVAYVHPDRRVGADELLSRADAAMYAVKREAPGSAGLEPDLTEG
jgi:diguanylate cyclase (GGDEF)-like protein/PAS domain S-box-containing protein